MAGAANLAIRVGPQNVDRLFHCACSILVPGPRRHWSRGSMVDKAGAVSLKTAPPPAFCRARPLHRSTTALSPAVEWLYGAKPYVSLWCGHRLTAGPVTRDATDSLP